MIELGNYQNKKTKGIYTVLDCATNTTNKQDGQSMVIYTLTETARHPTRTLYVRSSEEFVKKFEKVRKM